MKFKRKHLEILVAVAGAIAGAGVTAYILQLKYDLSASRWTERYYEEKFDSVLPLLTNDQMEIVAKQVQMDEEFYQISQTTLKDTL